MLREMLPSEIDDFGKFLLYGPPGNFKTGWTAINCPKPAWWVDFERSTDTIKQLVLQGLVDDNDFKIARVTPDDKMRDVLAFVEKAKTEAATLVFDTLSSSQTFQLDEWMENQSRDMPMIQDFRKSTDVFSSILFGLQHSEINVVIIAHERDFYEGPLETRKFVGTGPSVTPALHDAVTRLVSGVFRLTNKSGLGGKSELVMQVSPHGMAIAKNRYGILEREIKNPTWDSFIKTEKGN